MKRIDTMSIRDILRHHHDLGLPRAEIAVAVSVSAGTVSNVLERAQAAGLSWPLPSDLDDDGLRAQLYPPAPRESGYAQPDWDDVLRELRAKRKRRRVRATRRTLWEEYRDETRAQGGKAYSYSQFCARLKAHQGMFVRCKRRFKDGKEHRYWSVVESQRSRTRCSTASSTTPIASSSRESPSASATNLRHSTAAATATEPRPEGRGPRAPAAPSRLQGRRCAAACCV